MLHSHFNVRCILALCSARMRNKIFHGYFTSSPLPWQFCFPFATPLIAVIPSAAHRETFVLLLCCTRSRGIPTLCAALMRLTGILTKMRARLPCLTLRSALLCKRTRESSLMLHGHSGQFRDPFDCKAALLRRAALLRMTEGKCIEYGNSILVQTAQKLWDTTLLKIKVCLG